MRAAPRRFLLPALVVVLALLVPLTGQATHRSADAALPSAESQLLSLTNAARSRAGLPALRPSSTLTSVARRWSDRMAASGTLGHNPSLGSQVSGWRRIAENVGMAGSVARVQELFMGSSGHRANILNRSYDRVGIGVTRTSSGTYWVTVDFMQSTSASTAPAPPRAVVAPVRKPAPAVRTATSRAAPRVRTRAVAPASRAAVRVAPAVRAVLAVRMDGDWGRGLDPYRGWLCYQFVERCSR